MDAGKNGSVDESEIQAAGARTFAEFDRNKDGVIQRSEFEIKPGDGEARQILPPFFFEEELEKGDSLSRIDFDRVVMARFNQIDANHDGLIDESESRTFGKGPDGRHIDPPMQANAKFIAAELRFGDRLVKDQPFSAEIQIEDTRRLFDGSTVTKRINGAMYRDGAGRTRREQPIDIGGISLVGSDNRPQMLVFLNDFAAGSQYFVDANSKTARRSPIRGGISPDVNGPPDAKAEDLGTKEIEGVRVTGTRVSFEIPAGNLGNDKPIQVVTENWFSPELQMIVYSKHVDPLAGEHIFRLVNLRRTEPSANLFEVPSGYKVIDGHRDE